jgi:SAM-dependent methyltransferase
MGAWHEDDELWRDLAPRLFDEERLAAAPAEVGALLELAEAGPDTRVLDLCCGPGRHSLELARLGLVVTGVDRTAAFLELGRVAAAEAELEVEWVREDARRFLREGAFDLAVCLYTSFGYFSDEENGRVAQNVRRSLAPGGAFVVEVTGKEVVAGGFSPRGWRESGEVLVLDEVSVSEGWESLVTRFLVVGPDGKRQRHVVEHRLYSAVELSRVLLDAGFASVEVFGDLEGAPYDTDAERLVAIARVS